MGSSEPITVSGFRFQPSFSLNTERRVFSQKIKPWLVTLLTLRGKLDYKQDPVNYVCLLVWWDPRNQSQFQVSGSNLLSVWIQSDVYFRKIDKFSKIFLTWKTGELIYCQTRLKIYTLFFQNCLVDIYPFVGPLIPLFWTSDPEWISCLHTFFPSHYSSDSPLVRHLLTSFTSSEEFYFGDSLPHNPHSGLFCSSLLKPWLVTVHDRPVWRISVWLSDRSEVTHNKITFVKNYLQ